MRNEKDEKGSKKGTAKDKKADSGKATKSAAKAASGADKGSAPKGQATTPSGKVYRLDQKGSGEARMVSRKDALADILKTDAFTEETATAMIDKGEVVFSTDFFYSTDLSLLAKVKRENGPIPDSKKGKPVITNDPTFGSIVFNRDKSLLGEIVQGDNGKMNVSYVHDSKEKTVKYVAKSWVLASEAQAEGFKKKQALVRQAIAEAALVPADDAPLTKEEKAEKAELEKELIEIKSTFDSAPYRMGAILDAVRAKKLYRIGKDGKPQTFAEYMDREFGINRSYGQLLAQLSGYHTVAIEGIKQSEQLQLSANTTTELMQGVNKLASEMGIGKTKGFEDLKPIIKEQMRLLVDVAPKDKDGNAQITPRFVQNFHDTLKDVIQSGMVEVDGKQYTLEDAKKKGIALSAIREQVIESTAQNLMAKSDLIRSEVQKSWEETNAPATPPKRSEPMEDFKGEPGDLGIVCSRHGNTKILSIGTGRFQTGCKCRWQIDADSGALLNIEVNGKRIRYEKA